MKLIEAKKFLLMLPSKYDDYTLVKTELAVDESDVVLNNSVVTSLFVDEETKEIQVMHQTEEEVKDILMK